MSLYPTPTLIRSIFLWKSWTPFLLLISFLLPNPIHGQTPTNHSPTYTIDFSVYPIGKTNWRDLYYQKKSGVYETLTFWSYERSPKHPYEGPLPIAFYRKEENPDPNGLPFYRTVATVQVPQTSDQQLLFFIPIAPDADAGGKEFHIVSLDESERNFPLDTITFINATGANLEGVFGNKPLFLKKGVSAPYDLTPFYSDETLIGLAVQFDGSLQKVLHSKWSFYPNYREIILLLPPKKSGSLRIQAFRITQHKEEIRPPGADPTTP